MAVDLVELLYSGLFVAVACGLYGWLIGVAWTPFLLAERCRALFDAFPTTHWIANYLLLMPLPAVLWGLLWGLAFPVLVEYPPSATAAPFFAAGVGATLVATAATLVGWPAVLLYGLPARGLDWYADWSFPRTAAVVVGGTVWYALFLAVPAVVLSVFAGFGQAMSAPSAAVAVLSPVAVSVPWGSA